MNKKFLIAALLLAAVLCGTDDARADDKMRKSLQLQLYQEHLAAQKEIRKVVPKDQVLKEEDPNLRPVTRSTGPTVTVERTTSTNYTLTKRKMGRVGDELYPAKVENKTGGVVIERTVNGVPAGRDVIQPDFIAPEMAEASQGVNTPGFVEDYTYPYREYYTNKKDPELQKQLPADVLVFDTGRFND